MPRFLTVSLLVPLLVLAPAPAAPVPKHLMPKDDPVCFPNQVGDRIVHELGEREVVMVVTKVEKTDASTKVTLELVASDGSRSHFQTVVATHRGLQVVEYAAQKLDPPVWILKLPHCDGNRWTETWKMGNQTWKLETVGWEDVTVPAGTLRAIRVERTELSAVADEFMGGTTYWYAPGLGCIKWSSGDQSRVLKSFTHGK